MDNEFLDFVHTAEDMLKQANELEELASQAAADPQALGEKREFCCQEIARLTEIVREINFFFLQPYESKFQDIIDAVAVAEVYELPSLVGEWQHGLSHILLSYLRTYFHDRKQLPQEEIEEAMSLTHYFMNLTDQEVGELLMMIADGCQVSAPQLSFKIMMEALQTAPTMLQAENITRLHSYVYRPEVIQAIEIQSCPVCGNENGEPYIAVHSYLSPAFKYDHMPVKLWMKCPKCENLYTRYTTIESLGNNFINHITPELKTRAIPRVNATGLHLRWELLQQLSSLTDGKDLLDVGVGKGEMLAVAQKLGFQVSAMESDIVAASDVSNLLNIPVFYTNLPAFQEDNQYSIITMGDSLDQLLNPVEGVKKAYSLLREDGILWLATPDYESGLARLMKMEDPVLLDPKRITYFKQDGLMKLLERTGFQVIHYTDSSLYRGSMELILKKSRKQHEEK